MLLAIALQPITIRETGSFSIFENVLSRVSNVIDASEKRGQRKRSNGGNKKKQGIITTETFITSLMISINFVNRLKPGRVKFLKYVYEKILVR